MLIGLNTPMATPAELVLSNAVGYNTNPAAEPEAQGSAFSEHNLWFGENFRFNDALLLDVGASANYQILKAFPDNHQLSLDLTLSQISTQGRISPYLFSSLSVFSDDLIPSDDRNVFTLRVGADITLSGRTSLMVSSSYKYSHFKDNAPLMFLPPLEKNGQRPLFSPAHLPDDTIERIYNARREHAFIVDTSLQLFLTPQLTASAGLNVEYTHSSLNLESYWQLTPSISLFQQIKDRWQLTMTGSLAAKKYIDLDKIYSNTPCQSSDAFGNGQSNGIGNQCGNGKMAGTGMGRVLIDDLPLTPRLDVGLHFFPNATFEIFSTFSLEHGEYPLNGDDYTEKVIKCGFSCSF